MEIHDLHAWKKHLLGQGQPFPVNQPTKTDTPTDILKKINKTAKETDSRGR